MCFPCCEEWSVSFSSKQHHVRHHSDAALGWTLVPVVPVVVRSRPLLWPHPGVLRLSKMISGVCWQGCCWLLEVLLLVCVCSLFQSWRDVPKSCLFMFALPKEAAWAVWADTALTVPEANFQCCLCYCKPAESLLCIYISYTAANVNELGLTHNLINSEGFSSSEVIILYVNNLGDFGTFPTVTVSFSITQLTTVIK